MEAKTTKTAHGKVLIGKQWFPVVSDSKEDGHEYREYAIEVDDLEAEPMDFHGNRTLVDIHIESENSAKSKWGSTTVSKAGWVKILFNKIQVYQFGFAGLDWALRHAADVVDELLDHSLFNWQLGEPFSDVVGKKIWYDNVPCEIEQIDDWGALYIKADEAHRFMKPPWWGHDDLSWADNEEEEENGKSELKIDLLDQKAWWWPGPDRENPEVEQDRVEIDWPRGRPEKPAERKPWPQTRNDLTLLSEFESYSNWSDEQIAAYNGDGHDYETDHDLLENEIIRRMDNSERRVEVIGLTLTANPPDPAAVITSVRTEDE